MTTYVLTLIANPELRHIDERDVQTLLDFLSQHNFVNVRVEILNPEIALDVFFSATPSLSLNDIRTKIVRYFDNTPFDVAVQDVLLRRKKMLISDMDSTIIGQECIDELAGELGIKDQVAQITERAMRGELDFESALIERVALLKGLPESSLTKVYQDKITLNPGAKTLVGTMSENGALCILVSGGFTFFTQRIAKDVGFQVQNGNILQIEKEVLTGEVSMPILGKEAKLVTLMEYQSKLALSIDQIIAVGDGANDLPMIEAAGMGVAYYAKPQVSLKADFSIRYTDLTSLLYIQGYSKSHFFEEKTL